MRFIKLSWFFVFVFFPLWASQIASVILVKYLQRLIIVTGMAD